MFDAICHECGGEGGMCACGGVSDPFLRGGAKEDADAMLRCAAETDLECLAVAWLVDEEGQITSEAVIAKDPAGSPVVFGPGRGHPIVLEAARYVRLSPDEVVPPDYTRELRDECQIELSPADARDLAEWLRSAGWRVSDKCGRRRRRSDILPELRRMRDAQEATGAKSVCWAWLVDEDGEPFAEVIVGLQGGALCLVDECGYETVSPDDGLVVSLPKDGDHLAEPLSAAGFAVRSPRTSLPETVVIAYAECEPPTHRRFAKVLTATDTGRNGSHQSGVCIPAAVRGVLPNPLPGSNWPSAACEVTLAMQGVDGIVRETTVARVVSHTRGHKRPPETYLTSFLTRVSPREGDIMVVEHTGGPRYNVAFHREGTPEHTRWQARLGCRRFDIIT